MIFILAGALLIDLILGEFPNKFHPVVWMGSYIKFLWKKRITRSVTLLFVWGVLIIISGIGIFGVLPYWILKLIPGIFSFIISILMFTAVFSIKSLIKAGLEVKKALSEGNIEKARELTAWNLVSRDMSQMHEDDVVSAVIESLAENITDSFSSPLFYFTLGGIPAAWAYRFVNTSDSLIAYRKSDYEWGGKFTAWSDSLLNWIPSRITGVIICISALILRKNWKNSFKVMVSQHGNTSSPNAGWTMAAMAGALNIRLEKKGEYILNGGNKNLEYQLIDGAVNIVITSICITLFFIILLLEVIY